MKQENPHCKKIPWSRGRSMLEYSPPSVLISFLRAEVFVLQASYLQIPISSKDSCRTSDQCGCLKFLRFWNLDKMFNYSLKGSWKKSLVFFQQLTLFSQLILCECVCTQNHFNSNHILPVSSFFALAHSKFIRNTSVEKLGERSKSKQMKIKREGTAFVITIAQNVLNSRSHSLTEAKSIVFFLQDLPSITPHSHYESGAKAWLPPWDIWHE